MHNTTVHGFCFFMLFSDGLNSDHYIERFHYTIINTNLSRDLDLDLLFLPRPPSSPSSPFPRDGPSSLVVPPPTALGIRASSCRSHMIIT